MAEVMKHKKDLASLKMSEDKEITVYTFSVVVPSRLDIAYLPTYGKWRYNSLQTGSGYELEKMLDPVHQDIKLIITNQYQCHLSLKALDTEMSLRSVHFVSALFC